MSIDEIISEVKEDQMGVIITLHNGGGYKAQFNISYYDAQGTKHSCCSENVTLGRNKSIEIPAGSTRLSVNGQADIFCKCWSDIFTDTMYTPVNTTYRVWGTTLNTNWEKTGA